MKIRLPLAWALSLPLAFSPAHVMAQSTPSPSQAQRWLAGAGQTPDFHAPASRKAWSTEREKIRTQLRQLLGSLPPRPKKASVQTLGREERDGCVLERFQFDNGAGADVPGYLLLPKGARAKAPAVLYCHWHGGQYEIGKEELFGTNAVPEPPGPGPGPARLRGSGHRRLLLRAAQRPGAGWPGRDRFRRRNDRLKVLSLQPVARFGG